MSFDINVNDVRLFDSIKSLIRNMAAIVKRFLPKFSQHNLLEVDTKMFGFLGILPDQIGNLKSLSIFIGSWFLETLPGLFFILKHRHDVKAVFMCLHEFVCLLVYAIKFLTFYFRRHDLLKLVNDLRKEWNACEFESSSFD